MKETSHDDQKVKIQVDGLPEKSLLVGQELDNQTKDYLLFLRQKGAVVNIPIAMGCAEGIVLNADANMLACNSGPISIAKTWAKRLLQCMGFVKRRVTTKAKVSVENFKELKVQFLLDIKTVVTHEEIPLELVINWDQTAMHYILVSSRLRDQQGLKLMDT